MRTKDGEEYCPDRELEKADIPEQLMNDRIDRPSDSDFAARKISDIYGRASIAHCMFGT
jgi:hypothetical protein